MSPLWSDPYILYGRSPANTSAWGPLQGKYLQPSIAALQTCPGSFSVRSGQSRGEEKVADNENDSFFYFQHPDLIPSDTKCYFWLTNYLDEKKITWWQDLCIFLLSFYSTLLRPYTRIFFTMTKDFVHTNLQNHSRYFRLIHYFL